MTPEQNEKISDSVVESAKDLGFFHSTFAKASADKPAYLNFDGAKSILRLPEAPIHDRIIYRRNSSFADIQGGL